ncbi:MAG: TetR/AcrR family transcriptional regulator [Coriobacteriia bacterium]
MASRPGNPKLAADIIQATADIVEERGPEGVTMRAVGDRIGYSPTTIYLYFKNKDDLLKHALAKAYEWMTASITDAGGSPRERLACRAEAYVRWAINHPGLYRFMYESALLIPSDDDEMAEWMRGWEISRSILADGVAEGVVPERIDLPVVTTLNWAAAHGIAMLAISGRLSRPGVEASAAETEAAALQLTDVFVSLCFREVPQA